MHCKRTKTIIGTQKSVYRDFPIGKLEEQAMVSGLNVPLQQGFDCDSEACLPVGIDNLPAIAFEERIVGTVSFSQSTAMATPFACVPTINNFKNNVFIEAPACQDFSKFCERNPHNFFIEPFAFWAESFEVLNRNVCIKPQSHFGYLLNNFSEPVSDKVKLFVFEPFKAFSCFVASFVSKRLEFFFSFKNLFSFNPDIFSEISLFENFSFRGNNRNSKALAVDVDSQNISSLWQFGFWFGKICDNLTAGSQSECLTLPAISNKRGISLEVPVLLDWDSKSFSGIHTEFDKEVGFGVEGLAVTGNIELDYDSFDGCASAFDNIAFNVADNLAIERGGFLAC